MAELKPIGLIKWDIKEGDSVKILYMGDPDNVSEYVNIGKDKK